MIELLLAFAFWPWVVTILFLSCLVASTYYETTVLGFAGFLLFLAGIKFTTGTTIAHTVMENLTTNILLFLVYLAVGGVWSMFKWRNRVTSDYIQEKMKKAKESYMKLEPSAGPKDYMNSYSFPEEAKASSNKDRIVSWISLWPFSVIGYFIGEVLMNIFNKIYEYCSGVYTKITEHYAP